MELDRISEIQADLRQYKEIGISRTIQLLQYLLKSNLTKDQIKISKISKTVTTISMHLGDSQEEKEMVTVSKNLIQQWKKLFSMNQSDKKQGSPQKNLKKLSIDQVKIDVLSNKLQPKMRNKALETIYQQLMITQGKNIEVNQETILPLSENMEKAIWDNNNVHQDSDIAIRNYSSDMKKLLKNMKENPKLKIEIIKGVYTLTEIGKMDQKLFFSEKQKAELQKLKEEKAAQDDPDFWKKKKEEFQKTACDGEECEKCGGKKAYCVNEVQIRGADEPMTRFMRCDECNHNWQD